jgi:hypothetical protein
VGSLRGVAGWEGFNPNLWLCVDQGEECESRDVNASVNTSVSLMSHSMVNHGVDHVVRSLDKMLFP